MSFGKHTNDVDCAELLGNDGDLLLLLTSGRLSWVDTQSEPRLRLQAILGIDVCVLQVRRSSVGGAWVGSRFGKCWSGASAGLAGVVLRIVVAMLLATPSFITGACLS
mmetsp:Transcript_14443/g.22913  ORF Transcript_14443/g.22913 Transcript_14443/m.22913 type:complete len:108 (+) Transcript_14443:431-754(+)